MIDWNKVTGFDWDQGNAYKNEGKYGVSQTEIEQIFFNAPLLLLPDPKHSSQEDHFYV